MRLTDGDGVVDFEEEDDVKHDVVLLLFIHGGNIGAVTFGSGVGFEPEPSERIGEFRFGITTGAGFKYGCTYFSAKVSSIWSYVP